MVAELILSLPPGTGVNAICREAKKRHLPVSKDYVAKVRSRIAREAQSAGAQIISAAKDKEGSGAAVDKIMDHYGRRVTVAIKAPLSATILESQRRKALQDREENERKAKDAQKRAEEKTQEKQRQEEEMRKRMGVEAEAMKIKTENGKTVGFVDRVADSASLPDAISSRFARRLDTAETHDGGHTAGQVELPPELRAGTQRTAEGAAIRRTWVEDLLLQKPGLTSNDATLALQATFGLGLDNYVITEVLEAVRDLNGMRFIKRPRLPIALAPKKAADPNSPRLIEYLVGNETKYETCTLATLPEVLGRLGTQHGVDSRSATIWRPSSAKVRVVVEVEEED